MQFRLALAAFCFAVCCLATVSRLQAAPQAFEVGPFEVDELPKGKFGEGIIGDFVLRNDKVEATISGNFHNRRANFKTFRGTNGVNPGDIYDLTFRGADNDQLTIFAPDHQVGPVSWVRIVKPGTDGEAVIETVITAAKHKGIYKRHEYRIKDGWDGILITTTVKNERTETYWSWTDDVWSSFLRSGVMEGIAWADAVDPADRIGYAYGYTEQSPNITSPTSFQLKPGDTATWSRFLAVGTSPADALGKVAVLRGPAGTLSGVLKDKDGAPVTTAQILLRPENSFYKECIGYPDDKGQFSFRLPPGTYEIEVTDTGRQAITNKVAVKAKGTQNFSPVMTVASAVLFDIQDDTGGSTPCKVQFHGVNGTKSPDLGPATRAHGCKDQYHSEKGKFRVPLPPGDYKIIITRGLEYSHIERTIKVAPAKTIEFRGALKRLVDTTGWVSVDYHNHSIPSGDTSTSTEDRIINLVAEHIEFAPTTEHNRIHSWRPAIEKLGLTDFIKTIAGLELTGSGPHLIGFPYKPVPHTQDSGAPEWDRDPRLDALVLRDWQKPDPDRWVQLNHPDMVESFIDRDDDGKEDGGFTGLAQMLDGLETQNSNDSGILRGAPFRIGPDNIGLEKLYQSWEFLWLQMLNRGHRYSAVAVCDAHEVYGNGVGTWRMYIPSKSDNPAEIDWRENTRHAKAGRSILTSGPFLQVQTEDGQLPGANIQASGQIKLKVKVQCTSWIDIDRIQVLVNGRMPSSLNFTRASHPRMFSDGVVKFDQTITVPLKEDSHVIVVAYAENSDLSIGYGTSVQARMRPCAYHNPFFVDVDGNGFKANGDLLDWPLVTKKMTVEEVKKRIGTEPPMAPSRKTK